MMIVKALNIGLPKKEIFFGKEIITGIMQPPSVTAALNS